VPSENISAPKETVLQKNSREDYLYFKYQPKYQPLLNVRDFVPEEMSVFEEDEALPFADMDSFAVPNLSWSFVVDKKTRLYSLSPDKMTPDQEGLAAVKESGLAIWKKGTIRQSLEFPEGFKEFSVSAANASNFEANNNLDPHMVLRLDNADIGDAYVRGKSLSRYDFAYYTVEGWHKFEIEFENAYFNKGTGQDTNLLIGGIDIYELSGAVYFCVRKGLEERLLKGDISLSYLRSLPEEEKNKLMRYYKSRFKTQSLREILLRGAGADDLIMDVEISGLIKKAIFAPAPTEIRLKLDVPADGIKFVFGFAVMEEAWDKPGDGMEFRVRLDNAEGTAEELLFSRYINPKANEKDRKWFSGEVDLRRFKGRRIGLVFETRGSLLSPIKATADNSYDWAVWSK